MTPVRNLRVSTDISSVRDLPMRIGGEPAWLPDGIRFSSIFMMKMGKAK